jgi:hypothetical protein
MPPEYLESFFISLFCIIEYTHTVLPNIPIVTLYICKQDVFCVNASSEATNHTRLQKNVKRKSEKKIDKRESTTTIISDRC